MFMDQQPTSGDRRWRQSRPYNNYERRKGYSNEYSSSSASRRHAAQDDHQFFERGAERRMSENNSWEPPIANPSAHFAGDAPRARNEYSGSQTRVSKFAYEDIVDSTI